MNLDEIAPGLHHWVERHPEWEQSQGGAEGWGEVVGAVAYEGDGALVLIDPLVPDGDWRALDELVERAGGPVAIVVTCSWHRRDAEEAVARYVNLAREVTTHAHASVAEGLGLELTQAVETGAELPGGIEAFVTDSTNGEITLWLERAGAVVAGDVLVGADGERRDKLDVCPEAWFDGKNSREAVKAALRPLLERDVRAVVPLHGAPVTSGARAALERALS